MYDSDNVISCGRMSATCRSWISYHLADPYDIIYKTYHKESYECVPQLKGMPLFS